VHKVKSSLPASSTPDITPENEAVDLKQEPVATPTISPPAPITSDPAHIVPAAPVVPEEPAPCPLQPAEPSEPAATATDNAANSDSKVGDEKVKGEKIEKAVDVPSTLVGLLLSRGPQPNAVTVINQVQRLTSTFISKILSPKYTGKKITPKRRTAVPSPGPPALPKAPVSRKRETNSIDGHEDEDEEHVEDHKEEEGAGGEEAVESKPEEEEEEEEVYPVTFRIFSFAEENVDAAVAILQRMIAGDRIREVLDQARILTRGLQQFSDRISELYPSSVPRDRPARPQGSEERPSGGRHRPTDLHRRPAFGDRRKESIAGDEGAGKEQEDRGGRRGRGGRGERGRGRGGDSHPVEEKKDKPHNREGGDREGGGRGRGRGRDRRDRESNGQDSGG